MKMAWIKDTVTSKKKETYIKNVLLNMLLPYCSLYLELVNHAKRIL